MSFAVALVSAAFWIWGETAPLYAEVLLYDVRSAAVWKIGFGVIGFSFWLAAVVVYLRNMVAYHVFGKYSGSVAWEHSRFFPLQLTGALLPWVAICLKYWQDYGIEFRGAITTLSVVALCYILHLASFLWLIRLQLPDVMQHVICCVVALLHKIATLYFSDVSAAPSQPVAAVLPPMFTWCIVAYWYRVTGWRLAKSAALLPNAPRFEVAAKGGAESFAVIEQVQEEDESEEEVPNEFLVEAKKVFNKYKTLDAWI